MRAVLLAVAAVAASLAFAATATGWTSNSFYNPGGNIQCQFTPTFKMRVGGKLQSNPPMLQCEVNSNGHEVTLLPTVRAYADAGHASGELGQLWGHVLGYGQTWHSHQFTCLSTYGGMRCWTSSFVHGFFANAWEIQTW